MGRKNWFDRLLAKVITPMNAEETSFTFDNLNATTRVTVTNNLNKVFKEIEDRETIQRVLNFVKGHQHGWQVPPEGVPVAKLRLNFYKGDRPLGIVGVSQSFLTAHQQGGFFSKSSIPEEREKVLEIVGMADFDQKTGPPSLPVPPKI